MNADLIFSKLEGLLGEIVIDIRFAPEYDLEHEGMFDPGDYYDQDEIPAEGEPSIQGILPGECNYENPNYVPPIPLWEVTYNGLYREQFINTIKSYAGSIVLEYQKELSISRYIGDPVFSTEQLLKLIGDTYKRITYDDDLNTYTMSHIGYTDLMSQHNFINRYNNDMQLFFKNLRQACHDILMETMEEPTKTPCRMIWKRDKNDLIELAKALVLAKAITNSNNNITYTEAYKFFGSIFNLDLKNPADQLREKSENLDTAFFLEELHQAFQEDILRLRRNREGKKSN